VAMCLCCRRKHRSTRRRHRHGNVLKAPVRDDKKTAQEPLDPQEPVDPVGCNLLHVPHLPPNKLATADVDGHDVPKALLDVGDALVLPTKGKTAVKRVFLGVGWRSAPGARVDVDCCVAPYAKGDRSEDDTVWFGNLNSSKDETGYSFIKHSGDILSGQDGPGALEDLERLYVDLENCPTNYDCLAFEGNVYTGGVAFGALESCYIRLVNADTNQEILRCDLGVAHLRDGTSRAGQLADRRVVLLAKLFRGRDRWVLHAAVEGRTKQLRHLQGTQVDMVIGQADSGEMPAPVVSQTIERGEHRSARLVRRASEKAQSGRRAARPHNSYLMPAAAIGTVAGVAGAVALFNADVPLSMENMSAAGGGADFSFLSDVFVGTDCGCLSDFVCCGLDIGDQLGNGMDFCCRGGLCESLDVVDPCEVFQPLVQSIGSVCFLVGELCTAGCDAGSDAFSGICYGVPFEDACDCGNLLEQIGAGIGGSCGDAFKGCGGVLGQLQDGAGGCCCCDNPEELMDAAGSFAADAGRVMEGATGAVVEGGSELVEGLANVIVDVGQMVL